MGERIADPQISPIRLQESASLVKNPLVRIILEKISDGILWIDLQGKIGIANPSVEKMLSLNQAEGKVFWDLWPDDFFGFSMRESLRYGIAHERFYKNHLEISSTFLYQGDKSGHGLLIKVTDITDREKFRQKVTQDEQMKELGNMAARLAHEIRNPLGGIRGFAMLLQRDLANQLHLQELTSQIIEGTRSLERLVSNMLEFARPAKIDLQTQDITAFLRKTLRFIKIDPSFPPHVRLHLHIPDEPILLPFDADALKRALFNLTSNAVQAMEQVGELTVSLLKNGQNCQITISDTGVGMDEETIASLFIPFFTTKRCGNGLGLVETKKIIGLHAGTLEIHSTPERGSSFILTLPMRRQ